MHWSYVFLALTHHNVIIMIVKILLRMDMKRLNGNFHKLWITTYFRTDRNHEINNNKQVYSQSQVRNPADSGVEWAECSLIIWTGYWVFCFQLDPRWLSQRAFTLLDIRFRRPWFELCIQQVTFGRACPSLDMVSRGLISIEFNRRLTFTGWDTICIS